jgi:hypothetical protein
MEEFNANLAQEASAPTTDPSRLKKLSSNMSLIPLIAANPSCPLHILSRLAPLRPLEVLSNPIVESWLSNQNCDQDDFLDLHAMISLLLAKGVAAPGFLVHCVRSRFNQALEDVYPNIDVIRVETWSYERNLSESDFEDHQLQEMGLEGIDIGIKLEIEMSGNDIASLDLSCLAEENGYQGFLPLLLSLRNSSPELLFNVAGSFDELDLVMTNEMQERVSIESFTDDVVVDDLWIKNQLGEQLFRINAYYSSTSDDDDEPIVLQGDTLLVPIQNHVDSTVDSTRFELCSLDELGELLPMWGWEPSVIAAEVPKGSWSEWLLGQLFG